MRTRPPTELSHIYDENPRQTGQSPCVRLLEDAPTGDQRLFTRGDGVEQALRIVDPVLHDSPPLHEYEPGSTGPAAADTLAERDGGWHAPELQ